MGVEEVLAEAKARIEELCAPINGGVGEDVSYNEKFEAMKTETEKLSSLTGETVNWSSVETFAVELLSEKTKDFRVACYFAAAKGRTGKVSDLLDGLMVLDELQKAFWDTMHPPAKRMRARAGIFQWFIETTGPTALELKVSVRDYDTVQALDQVSRELDTALREKMGEAYPGLGKLREATRHLVGTCPKPAPPAPPPEAAPAGGEAQVYTPEEPQVYVPEPEPGMMYGGGGGDVVNVGMVADADQALEALGKARTLVTHIASLLRQAKPENPAAYRLLRASLWIELQDPPAVMDGNTMLPPPNWEYVARFEALVAAEDWLTLIHEAEAAAIENPMWLDPHRYTALAMDRAGFQFNKAKKALVYEMAVLIARFPTLANLTFNTGDPYASPQTKMWLESEVSAVLSAGGGKGGGVSSSLEEPLGQAKSLVVQGKLGEAVDLLGRAVATAPTPAERFRGKLALAQLCLRAGKLDIARAQLEGLHKQIEAHHLTAWEPGLCGEVYAALYAAHQGLNAAGAATPEAWAAQQAAFERLCQLDPAAALKLVAEAPPPAA